MSIYPVILCGGSGTRLWPASRPGHPKQFLPLTGELSSFQETLRRIAPISGARTPIIVTGQSMVEAVEAQAAQIGLPIRLLIEPEARDSGPAVAAAAALVMGEDPEGIVVMLASDHHVGEPELFVEAVVQASAIAADNYIVTFGIRPTSPATGYGYIQAGDAVGNGGFRVQAFVEKPDLAKARTYVDQGYFWNSGNFAFRAGLLIEEMRRFEPALASGAEAAVMQARRTGQQIWLDPAAFATATRKSLDFAVMERTSRAAVAPASFSWSDLGAWDAILAASPTDAEGNATTGPAILIDSQRVLVRTDGPVVGVIGLDDIAVIVEDGQVLVCRLSDAQKVKTVAEQAKLLARDVPRP